MDDLNSLIAVLSGRGLQLSAASSGTWESVAALAESHGVAPLLWQRLGGSRAGLPVGVSMRLHDAYAATAARSMRTLHELRAMLRAFRSVDVQVVALKGASLAESVYGDPTLRPMADIDLLVKPVDLGRAVDALRALGYDSAQPFDPGASMTGFQDMPLMSKPGHTPIELHWTLVTPLCNARISLDELDGIWNRAVKATIAGEAALMLAPEDLLLHLCMHASVHHRFSGVGLRAFVDIAEVARHYEDSLDWDAFAARANCWGVANGVRISLALAGEWTPFAAPEGVLELLDGDPPDEPTLEWARQKVLKWVPAVFNSEMARLEAGGGNSGRLAALRDAAFAPRAVLARMYSVPPRSWRILVYYPVRWKDLWARYHGALWKLARRDREFVEDTRREARLRKYLGWT